MPTEIITRTLEEEHVQFLEKIAFWQSTSINFTDWI